MANMIITLLFFAAFFVCFVWRIVQRGLQTRELAERGVPVIGEVVDKFSHRSPKSFRSRHLRYRFRAPDGHEYSHRIMVSSEEYQTLKEGGPIELVYLPDKPKISAMRSMVDLVRDSLEKQARNKN